MRRRMKSVAAPAALVAAAAMLLTGLTACSGTAQAAGSEADLASRGCTNMLQPGALSNGVHVGDDGSIDVVGPTNIANAQRSVIELGDRGGYVSQPGDIVSVKLTSVNAVTGQTIEDRPASPHLALPESLVSDVEEALHSENSNGVTFDYLVAASLVCAVPGDTIVLAMTATQSLASQVGADAAVAVIEVIDTFPSTARGSQRALPNGFPAVTTDETGQPGIVLPPQAAPSEQRVAPRIEGDGAAVTEESAVFGQVLTVDWNGSVVTNTWERGIVGFGTQENPNPEYPVREALTGFTVGSQVIILDPNDGDPVVHVVDIIAAV